MGSDTTNNYHNFSEPMANPSGRRRTFRWRPSSLQELEDAERKLLSYLTSPFETKFVHGGEFLQPRSCCRAAKLKTIKLNTLIINKSSTQMPLVFFHGIILGLGFETFILNEIAKQRPVYVLDLPGYGRSSRIIFPNDARNAEELYVQILENWRSALGLEKFILAGQSLGGFLVTAYTLRHPNRVTHLIPLDPWGYPTFPKNPTDVLGIKNSFAIKMFGFAAKYVNAMGYIRKLGPFGEITSRKTQLVDVKEIIESNYGLEMRRVMSEYIYHCIAAGKPSGETAFRVMSKCAVYAKNPLSARLHLIAADIPVTIIYPESSYCPAIPNDEIRGLFDAKINLNIHTLPSMNHDTMLLQPDLAKFVCDILINE